MRHFVINAILTLFLIASLALTGLAARAVLRSVGSETWPVAEGRVALTDILLSSGSESAGRRTSVFYTPYVRYEYHFRGKSYTSDVISFMPEGHSDRAIAVEFLKDYPLGGKVLVYVNPDDPATAVLMPGQNTAMMMALFFAAGFLVISVAALAGYNLFHYGYLRPRSGLRITSLS